ncbi:MAG: AAA family ATPase [Clostridiales bacterium]|jgi:lon-related putative ATP-dependent protease|nr:AAA family ATPase [Clostridiales bacterium]
MLRELDYTELKKNIDPQILGFETTAQISTTPEIIGQSRAAATLQFGLNIKAKGYSIYVSGTPGTGRSTFAKAFACAQAAKERTPSDLCYVYNFENPKCPKVLELPAGSGKALKEQMDELINRLLNELPPLFANREFEAQKSEIVKVYQEQRDSVIKIITEEAREQNFGVKNTNSGIYFMPIVDGEVISEEQYDALSQEQKDVISTDSEFIQKRASEAMRQIKEYERQTRKEVEEMEYSIGLFAVGRHINAILFEYADHPQVVSYLLSVKEDILEHIEDFAVEDGDEEEGMQSYLPWYNKKGGEDVFSKYKINLVTDNSRQEGAPVIVDFNPTYANLVGEIEYDNEFGNFSTDFMKIKPGLLHKANGGYLILQAHDVLANYHSWETIRRVLLTGEIAIEPAREYATGIAVSGIKPQPIKADVKVILIGTELLYELLYEYDEDFQKLFKIRADFDCEMQMNDENISSVCKFIKNFVDKEKAPDFDAEAAAKVIEMSARLAERQNKMSARFNKISELLAESAAWAQMEDAPLVQERHVRKAIFEQERRLNMYEEKLTEMIEDGTILIDTEGFKVGQINGLAVLDMGDYAFAKPSRITATSYVGKAGIVNIEKEADMSGSIHEKGVQVLIGYLGQTYAQDFPLSLSCRICFEQNYSGIDGDSASSVELYAVMSSLSRIPINQSLAVTGSMNQRGEIQPIGGVTYKIEGFFDLCSKRGLTGGQGVIIPKSNTPDLMLRDEVAEAVKAGLFHIYSIETVDEGIELLTGVPAGVMNEKGKYPSDTVHGKVIRRLKDFYRKAIEE